jgi:GDP-4-dehydro-6-deoxy-D-mannose reductase
VAALAGARIWVTGAGGFVGRHLVPHLRAAGAEVVVTDHEVDAADPAEVAAAMARARPDAVAHLAARSSVAASAANARGVFEVNYLGTAALLAAAARCSPAPRVLLAGTGQVYGSAAPGAPPFAEDAPLRPASPYAWSKAAGDLLGADYAARGVPVVRARAFNHTGAGQSEVFAASSFARQLVEIELGQREPVLRVGNLDSVRDFLAVEDVVEAYARLLQPDVPAGVYNIASGRGRSLRQVLDLLLARVQVEPRVEVDPARFRPVEVSVGDPTRLAETTGWEPRRSLEGCLEGVLASWRQRLARAGAS